ncbi:MAG: leucine-rich repeat protein, partial [Clostridia bacterium]|nr:leucine-rich repeat protein [Clostridia bacterium]
MNFLKRFISIVSCMAVVMTAVPAQLPAKAAAKVYSIDTSSIDATAANITMTDADFFALLDLTSSDMTAVKIAVDAKDYTAAKKELLSYYQSKFVDSESMPVYYSGVLEWMNYLAMNDAYAFTENHLGNVTVPGNTDGVFHDYYVDLGNNHANGVFVLSSLSKSDAALEIVAREHTSGAELGAELIFYKSGEAVKTLSVARDTFVRGGSYGDTNYGQQAYLNVKCDVSSTLPYTANSRIGYLYFEPSEIPASGAYDNVKLKIYARSQVDDIKLEVFDAYNKSWAEYEGDGSGYKPMTWNNYKIAHYSWKNVDGGFDWNKPANTATEWFNYNARFYDQVSLMITAENNGFSADKTDKYGYTYAEYAQKSLAIMQDFANDTYGRIAANTGVPDSRDIESANRCMEFPALYARYVKLLDSSSDHDAQLNINMLKWLYTELTYLYNGACTMYDGSTTTVKNTEIAYNNRGVWHVYGFLSSAFNFNEFSDFSSWQTIAEARLAQNMSKLVLSDGAYGEATFNYPTMVINYWVSLAQLYLQKGIAYPENYIDNVSRVMKYLMDCTYPNGVTPNWGHGPCQPRSSISRWLKTGLFTVENGVDPEVLAALESYAANTAPAYNDALYDDMRIAVARTGWSSNDSVLFMNAKNGRSHSHKDSLAFTWYHNGGELLTDTGMTSYDSGHPHFIFQQSSTNSHNTVEVDSTGQRNANQPQNDGDSSISIISNDGAAFISGYTDANRHTNGIQVDHYRNVTYLKDLNLIISNDMLVSLDGESHTYKQNWHTQTTTQRAVTADNTNKQAYTSYSNGRNLIVAQPAGDDSTVSVSTDGLDERFSNTTHYMTFEKSGSGTVNFNTVLKAVDNDDEVSVSVEDKGSDSNNSTIDITVTENGATDTYTHFSGFDSNTTRTFLGYTTDAASVTLSKDASGNMDYISLMGGGTLSSSDKTYFDFADATNVTVTKDGTTLNVYTDAAAGDDFQLAGFGTDIKTVVINGTSYKAMTNGDTIKVYADSLEWSYYADKGLLYVYGEGDIGSVDFSRYSAAQTLWLGKDVTVAADCKLTELPNVTKVYMDEKYFDISWQTTTANTTYNSTGYISGNTQLPDTWAKRINTINSSYKIITNDSAAYIPASGTDSKAYNPKEDTTEWTYTCATPTASYDWEINVASGKLTISDGAMSGGSVRSSGFWPWATAADIITAIYLDDTFTGVGKNAFSALDNVSDIRFSPSMTAFNMYMFDGNKALEKVIIPGNIASVSKYSFRSCTALKEVILSNGVTAVGEQAFYGSGAITYAAIPGSTTVPANSGIPTTATFYTGDSLATSGTVNGQQNLTWTYDSASDTLT